MTKIAIRTSRQRHAKPHSKGIDSGLHCAALVWGLAEKATWKGDRSWLGANVMHHALEEKKCNTSCANRHN